MNSRPFNWKHWREGALPELEPHSQIKLDVLQQYVESYIEILFGKIFGAPDAELVIVDGFCGGGIYHGGVEGSPLILLRAAKVAEFKIQAAKTSPFSLKCQFYFIDSCKRAIECLENYLRGAGYGPEIGKTIHLIHGDFSVVYKDVIRATKTGRSRGKRTIFFLDQCGYSKVDMRLIPDISTALGNKAEFIVNLAISWMLDFMKGDDQFRDIFAKLGVSEYVNLDDLLRIKQERQGDWHYIIESRIGPAVWRATQCPFYSPFYVRPVDHRRGYWLLHLAPHERARTAMMDVLWAKGNGSLHYGGCGLRMHEFRPDKDQSLYFEGFSLSEMNQARCVNELSTDVGALFRDQQIERIRFSELLTLVCNDTVANPSLLKRAISQLESQADLCIYGKNNGSKRGDTLSDGDIIEPAAQKAFAFIGGCKSRKRAPVS